LFVRPLLFLWYPLVLAKEFIMTSENFNIVPLSWTRGRGTAHGALLATARCNKIEILIKPTGVMAGHY